MTYVLCILNFKITLIHYLFLRCMQSGQFDTPADKRLIVTHIWEVEILEYA